LPSSTLTVLLFELAEATSSRQSPLKSPVTTAVGPAVTRKSPLGERRFRPGVGYPF
jgi:hypothetical protein